MFGDISMTDKSPIGSTGDFFEVDAARAVSSIAADAGV